MSKLQLTARQVVEGVITGLHKSPHRGFSVEFSEHREYTPGDEIRHLDWRAYARSDRYYVKLYEQETNLRATLVLDTSGSMKFAGKFDYGRHLAACIAYLLAMQQDLAGLAAIDSKVRIDLPPGLRRRIWIGCSNHWKDWCRGNRRTWWQVCMAWGSGCRGGAS